MILHLVILSNSMLSGSPLLQWIDYASALFAAQNGYGFNQSTVPTGMGCSTGGPLTNCSNVCSNTTQLFDPAFPENIVTCASWASTCTFLNEEKVNSESISTNWTFLHPPFEEVGLNLSNNSSDMMVEGLTGDVTACLADLYQRSHYSAETPDIPSACSKSNLFSYHGTTLDLGESGTRPCIEELCTPSQLDPDIGGIGVSPHTTKAVTVLIEFNKLSLRYQYPSSCKVASPC